MWIEIGQKGRSRSYAPAAIGLECAVKVETSTGGWGRAAEGKRVRGYCTAANEIEMQLQLQVTNAHTHSTHTLCTLHTRSTATNFARLTSSRDVVSAEFRLVRGTATATATRTCCCCLLLQLPHLRDQLHMWSCFSIWRKFKMSLCRIHFSAPLAAAAINYILASYSDRNQIESKLNSANFPAKDLDYADDDVISAT